MIETLSILPTYTSHIVNRAHIVYAVCMYYYVPSAHHHDQQHITDQCCLHICKYTNLTNSDQHTPLMYGLSW